MEFTHFILNRVRSILGTRTYYKLGNIWHKFRGQEAARTTNVRDWQVLLDHPNLDPILKTMMLSFKAHQRDNMISNYWKELNDKHLSQLLELGFDNFKQNVALNYFNWPLREYNPQVKFLIKKLPRDTVSWAKQQAQTANHHKIFSPEQSKYFNFITFLLWKFVEKQEGQNLLDNLEEPLIGNPLAVRLNQKLISQDIANSVLEYQSMAKNGIDFQSIHTILEIGAGYGRTAYVILRLNPHIRYIIVDIPPALYVSQRYLSKTFPDRKIFAFRNFDKFSQVKADFRSSNMIFLMPFQLPKLPDDTVDLCLAIDCLHEMLPETIDRYFDTFERLGNSLYFKCSKEYTIPHDLITLKEKDYPIRSHWKKMFWKTCVVQSSYFETLLTLKPKK